MTSQKSIDKFLEELDQLLDDVFISIDSALLTDDFVSKADHALVIPNIRSEDFSAESHDDSSNTA